jgi:hypothetical protein
VAAVYCCASFNTSFHDNDIFLFAFIPVITFPGPDFIDFLPVILDSIQGTESVIDCQNFGILNAIVTVGVRPVIFCQGKDQ